MVKVWCAPVAGFKNFKDGSIIQCIRIEPTNFKGNDCFHRVSKIPKNSNISPLKICLKMENCSSTYTYIHSKVYIAGLEPIILLKLPNYKLCFRALLQSQAYIMLNIMLNN